MRNIKRRIFPKMSILSRVSVSKIHKKTIISQFRIFVITHMQKHK